MANDMDSARADDCVCLRTLINDGLASGRSDSGRRVLFAVAISVCSTELNVAVHMKGQEECAGGPVSRPPPPPQHILRLPNPVLGGARNRLED